MHNFQNVHGLISYLKVQLIPDLRESGSDATADDFEDCVAHLEDLASGPAKLGVVLSAAEVRRDQWSAVAGGQDPANVIDELYEAAGLEESGAEDECTRMTDLLTESLDNVREFYSDK